MIDEAIDNVTSNIKTFGDIVLPADRDPYVYDEYARRGREGSFISMQSPSEGPAYGRKLTWGNVRDTLVGLKEIMVKNRKPYKTTFEIWNDNLGLVGTGEVAPGKPSRWVGSRGGLEERH